MSQDAEKGKIQKQNKARIILSKSNAGFQNSSSYVIHSLMSCGLAQRAETYVYEKGIRGSRVQVGKEMCVCKYERQFSGVLGEKLTIGQYTGIIFQRRHGETEICHCLEHA